MNIENLKDEVWMAHPKYNWLQASNYGRIKSLERDVIYKDGRVWRKEEKLIKASQIKNGYLRFNICKNGKIVDKPLAHRFVYECFHQMIIPKDIKEYQINHIDENKINNCIENLELCTSQYNIDYSKSKSVGQYTLDGKLVKKWKSTAECGRNGFKQQAVSACCNNKFHREGNNIYKKFIWKYIEE